MAESLKDGTSNYLIKEILFSIIFNLITISVVEKILMPLIGNKNFISKFDILPLTPVFLPHACSCETTISKQQSTYHPFFSLFYLSLNIIWINICNANIYFWTLRRYRYLKLNYLHASTYIKIRMFFRFWQVQQKTWFSWISEWRWPSPPLSSQCCWMPSPAYSSRRSRPLGSVSYFNVWLDISISEFHKVRKIYT